MFTIASLAGELKQCPFFVVVAKAVALLCNPSFADATPRNVKAPALCGDTLSCRRWPIFLTCYNIGFHTSFLYNELPVNRVSVVELTMQATIRRGKPGNDFLKKRGGILTHNPTHNCRLLGAVVSV